MLRRSVVLIPLLALAAALLGLALPGQPLLVAAGALLAGLAVGTVLASAAERRIGRVTERVRGFADGDTSPVVRPGGSPQWQRLAEALTGVGVSLQSRFDELAGERARIERLLDDLPLAVLLVTQEGLAYANPAARRMFDGAVALVARESTGTAGPHRRIDRLGVEGLADAVAEVSETGRTVEVDLVHDGRDLRVRASTTAPGEIALVCTDLTESRRVDAIRRDFVTNASHELKTPVAGMQALAESLTLAVDRDPERTRRMLGRLQTEAVRLAQLVRELLDLARLEEATAQRSRRVDLADLVRSQVERTARLADERGVIVTTDLPEDASVIAVPEDVRLIVGNLVENAVLYNREGGAVQVTVTRGAGEVSLQVSDTGTGIPPVDRDRVFERFYRVDKGRSRAAGGTGLGLSLVRHAAERHGGRASLVRSSSEGSTFLAVLPVEGAGRGG